MIFTLAAMLLVPVEDQPFTIDQWAECGQIALFRSESATGDIQKALLREASDFFDKAGELQFPGKELDEPEYEMLAERGHARLQAQVRKVQASQMAQYANITLLTCRVKIGRI